MSSFRDLTPRFAVSPQIKREDFALAASEGFKMVINNRPDGESPDQLSHAEALEAAEAAGLDYVYIPVVGGFPPDKVASTLEAITKAKGPILAYCRSGTRSSHLWALAQALRGMQADELLTIAATKGYDLRGIRADLVRLNNT
jgi:uncharacterized protein (TIGR01244 family)